MSASDDKTIKVRKQGSTLHFALGQLCAGDGVVKISHNFFCACP